MATSGKSGVRRKFLWSGGILLVALLFALFFLRTTALKYAGELVFGFYGFDEAVLTIDAVNVDQITIGELSLSDQIKLRDVDLYYKPFSVLRGEIDKVEIGTLFVDISNPEEGAIKRIISLANEGSGNSEAVQTRQLPAIHLKTGQVFATNGDSSFQAEFTAGFTANQILDAKGTVEGQVKTVSGPIELENMALSLRADIGVQSATFALSEGVIRHAGPEPYWAPLMLMGKGELAAGISSLEMSVRTMDGHPLMDLTGNYEVANATGRAQLQIEALPFRREGLQPADLTRYAERLPPFDGTLKFVTNAEIAGPAITYAGDLVIEDMAIEITDGHIASSRFPLKFQGQYHLEENTQDAQITLQKTEVSGEVDDLKLAASDLTAELKVQNIFEKIELQLLGGMIRDTGRSPDFLPFNFTLSGEMSSLQEMSLQGDVRSSAQNLKVDVSAQYQLESGQGKLTFQMPETKIGKGGVSLAGLSAHLKDIENSLSGNLSASGEITRDVEGNLMVSSLFAELLEGRWQDTAFAAEGIAFKVSGGQSEKKTLFKGVVTGGTKNVRLDTQNIAVSDVEASFETGITDLIPAKNGRIALSSLRLVPKDGALFKETQKVTGDARLRNDKIDFSLALTSDFLGKYLQLEGSHSLERSTGSARVLVNPLSFTEGGLQPADLIVIETEVTVKGKIVPAGDVSWSGKGIKSSADVRLEDISVKAAGGNISDINGMVHIDELSPFTISSPQEIVARTASAGIPLENPVLRFRVLTRNGAPILYIERLTLGLVGGSAIIEDALIDTGAEINRVEIQLTRLDLEQVMALSNVEELVATGHVSGKIPLVFGGTRLLVEDGLLAADGPGVLKMTSEAARQALGAGGEQAKLLLDVLENFRYSELSIQVTKTESGEDTVKLHAAGSNPDVENDRPVILNINLTTSLDKIFNAILSGYLLSEKALRATVDGR
ncbi:YdbH domain-containing protein [Sneathiella sp. CAU 1612]|uniref:YdbH domain-containing protein n=1 Tax=Sneathiella sedimenti TaxID=2816034 RepID=A0ABS3F5W1_9PROT|nr:YdbH domain-containing protein [Sneathiella sedimenti]MBO0333868.1 YdbH domain-containing protein [Sneathiella sedimenti]